ncbi:MAG: PQQ-binding-like beta-propeller repeat protein [Methanospirillum sp.]|nr:PQQ-binding-like beta-propeller repeat protein [Methanospirillum sp.]
MLRPALLCLLCLALVAPALATAPLWTHSSPGAVRACAVSSEGSLAVTSSDLMRFFDRDGTEIASTWRASDIAVGPKGNLVVAGTAGGVSGYARNGSLLWTVPVDGVTAVGVSGDGKTVASAGSGGRVTVATSTGTQVGSRTTKGGGEVADLAVSQNGSVVVVADRSGVHAFTRKASRRWSVDLPDPNALAVNGSGDLIAVGDIGSVRFYNATGKRVAQVTTTSGVRALAMTPSANLTVAGTQDGTVTALDPAGGLLWTAAAGSWVSQVAVSAGGSAVAVASNDRRLHLLDRDGTALWRADLPGTPRSLALSPDGTRVIVGCDDGTTLLFDTGVRAPAATTPARTMKASTPLPKPSAATSAPKPSAATPAITTGDAVSASPTTVQVVTVERSAGAGGTATLGAVSVLLLLGAWARFRRRG